ncbi:MAG: hypothetical protein IT384_32540 [Deltaproteobacteria bacterium]|nr:hypothetical protein [Deltaproteobacteria bacterium]
MNVVARCAARISEGSDLRLSPGVQNRQQLDPKVVISALGIDVTELGQAHMARFAVLLWLDGHQSDAESEVVGHDGVTGFMERNAGELVGKGDHRG